MHWTSGEEGRCPNNTHRETQREHDTIEDDLDRRKGPATTPGDGSGEHGALEPNAVDHANHAFWRSVAIAAEGIGLVHAARGMHHYLDNSGDTLDIDPELVLRDAAPVQEELAYHQGWVTNEVLDVIESTPENKPLSKRVQSPLLSKDDFYINQSDSADWFFAMAGHGAFLEGTCEYVPDMNSKEENEGTMFFDLEFHLRDDYNWDQGKTVTIAGITISDEVAGRLHKVGLAQEFLTYGVMPLTFEIAYFGPNVTPNLPGASPAPDREGTRTDPDRERA